MKSKRIIAFLAAVSLTASVMPASVCAYDADLSMVYTLSVPAETAAEETTAPEDELTVFGEAVYICGDFNYTLDKAGNARITAYTGSDRIVVIPASLDNNPVTSIGNKAFCNMDFITSVTIGNNITSIEDYAFAYCNNLGEIVIPDSVTSMGESVFIECTALKKAVIGAGLTYIPNSAFQFCSRLESVAIGANISEIRSLAFRNSGLTAIVIPDSVKVIKSQAFDGCSEMKTITFGNSLTTIGYNAFRNCDSLTSVDIPNTVSTLEQETFAECDALKSVSIGSGMTNTGEYTFSNCPSLESVKLASSITTISKGAFLNCKGLKTFVIPDTIEYISKDAFQGCTALSDLTFGRNVKSIGALAFKNCDSLTTVILPENLTSLGEHSFDNCSNLKAISFGKNLTAVSKYSLQDCTALTDVVISDGVLEISTGAFEYDYNIKRMYIPTSVNYIRNSVFASNDKLKMDVFFGGSKSEWDSLAIGNTGNTYFKNNSTVYYDCPEPVNITSLKMANGAPTLTWTASSGAGAYRIYRSENLNGTLKYLGSVRTRTFADTTAVVGKTYYYHVMAMKDADSFSYSIPKRITVTNVVSAPAAPKATVTAGTNSAVIRWNAVSGATAYRVFYRVNGTTKWAYKNTTKTAMNLTGLTGGKKYDILVRAYNGNTKLWSNYTSANILNVTPKKAIAKPTVTSVTGGVNRAVIRWNAVSGAKSYRVYYRVKGTTAWSCKNTSLTAMNLTGLTGGKTYEIVVRATDGTVWSAMTTADIKTVIVKKA